MIKLHYLNDSRSQRILWFLEELGCNFELIAYEREETRFAPEELKKIHPLGKSPVLDDDGRIVAESGTIIEYLSAEYGDGKFTPEAGSDDYWRYNHFLHYAEGSAMLPLMLAMYTGVLGEAAAPLHPRIFSEIENHFSYLESELIGRDYMAGDHLTGADIQITFVLEAANTNGLLAPYPNLQRYLAAMQARPAYLSALKKGGTYAYGPK